MNDGLLEEYYKWVKKSLEKQDGDSSSHEQHELVSKSIHIGSMYADDIISIIGFLEEKNLPFEFRILDRMAGRSGKMARHVSVTNEVFCSKSEFENYIDDNELLDFVFFEFLCISFGSKPANIRWSAEDGLLHIIQKFDGDEIPDLQTENIVEILSEHVRGARNGFWFRHEHSIYSYTALCVSTLLWVKFHSWYLGVVCAILLLSMIAPISTMIEKIFGGSWGKLLRRNEFPKYLKKTRRVKLISTPVIWASTAILGAAIYDFAKVVVDGF